jgi:endonuclease/exonuclease/phosphatase (EEP) superfamily protein YafD
MHPFLLSLLRLSRAVAGWVSLCASLCLLPLVVLAYVRHHDRFTVFSVPPIWIWSVAGIVCAVASFCALRRRPILLIPWIWAGITMAFADEAKTLWNRSAERPEPGAAAVWNGMPVIRVVTMNCANSSSRGPAEEISVWKPDIILLQDADQDQIQKVSAQLFGASGHIGFHGPTNGVVSHWPIQCEIENSRARSQLVRIQMPDQRFLHVVNVHLQSAPTDLRFWRRATWTNHRIQRAKRLGEIDGILELLSSHTPFPMTPTLLGGDFNAPATDIVHSRFRQHFQDSFLQAGAGWGNTYHGRFPILRIDLLYHTPHCRAVRARTVESIHSDHRMLVVDYLLR